MSGFFLFALCKEDLGVRGLWVSVMVSVGGAVRFLLWTPIMDHLSGFESVF